MQALNRGETVPGVFIGYPSPATVRVCAAAGFRAVVVDLEHGAFDLSGAADLVTAARGLGMLTLVRVPDQTDTWLQRVLDLGPDGVVVPHVQRAEQVERLQRAVRYPPLGARGLGGMEYALGGLSGLVGASYTQHANDRVILVVQIEDAPALDALDDILAAPGVGMAFVGPTDLSQSLGHVGQPDHPDVQQAIARIFSAAARAGVPLGIFAGTAAQAVRYAEMGAALVCTNAHGLLAMASRDYTGAVSRARGAAAADGNAR